MVMGLHQNLEEATRMAIRETLDFITGRFPHIAREEAYMIATVAVDYHITQVVDGVKGVHGMIPKAIFYYAIAGRAEGSPPGLVLSCATSKLRHGNARVPGLASLPVDE